MLTHTTEPADRLYLLLRDMVQCCHEGESLRAKAHELSVGESRALVALKTEHCRTTSDLADQLSVAKSRITRIVDTLVEKQLVVRAQDHSDRRQCLVRLTPTGDRIADELITAIMKLHGEVMLSLPSSVRAEALATLAAIAEAMTSVKSRLMRGEIIALHS